MEIIESGLKRVHVLLIDRDACYYGRMNEALQRIFDATVFRTQGHLMVDRLADYLAAALGRQPMAVLPWAEPGAMVERWPDWFPTDPAADPQQELDELLGAVIAQSIHLHHPGYVGHQVTAPLPQAALWEMAGTLLNNAMPVYEMGPVGTAMEHNLVRWMGAQLGYDRLACDGVITSGGSAGNLTAMLAARQDRAGFDVWTEAPGKGSRCAYWLGKAPTTVCSVRYRSWGGGQRA